jgi:hypothetical protein
MKLAPPEGLSEDDYEAIEAAVMETVRGRWFLAEFARRSRVEEMRQVLDAIGRLEQVVVDQKTLPPADPSIRLLIQRLKDVSRQLDSLALDMRRNGQDEALCIKIESQARAVAGLLRFNGSPEPLPEPAPEPHRLPPAAPLVVPRAGAPEMALSATPEPKPDPVPDPTKEPGGDSRLSALKRIDTLSAAEKIALFG